MEKDTTKQTAEQFLKTYSGNPASRSAEYISVANAREYGKLLIREWLDKAEVELPTNTDIIDRADQEHLVVYDDARFQQNAIFNRGAKWMHSEASSIIAAKNAEMDTLREMNNSYSEELSNKNVEIERLKAAMQEFVDRVDKGEVRSTKTYNKFKALLNPNGDNN